MGVSGRVRRLGAGGKRRSLRESLATLVGGRPAANLHRRDAHLYAGPLSMAGCEAIDIT